MDHCSRTVPFYCRNFVREKANIESPGKKVYHLNNDVANWEASSNFVSKQPVLTAAMATSSSSTSSDIMDNGRKRPPNTMDTNPDETRTPSVPPIKKASHVHMDSKFNGRQKNVDFPEAQWSRNEQSTS